MTGWWAGAPDGRKYAPTITPGEWHTVLRKSGFAGVDAITPEIDPVAWPFSIIAAQAVDDRINFLRKPLARSSSSSTVYIDSLVILGDESLESARIGEEVAEYLGRFCGNITILSNLPTEAEAEALPPMSTFLNLVDIDSPIFKGMTTQKMEGLKRIYELAKHLLWITVNAQVENPFHMASITFSRAMSHEAGHISMNHLDFAGLGDDVPKVIAEHLLRQSALDEWEVPGERQQRQPFLWSKEPETFVERGQLRIPRLVDNVGQNARLNSSRRVITTNVPVSTANVAISQSAESSAPILVEELRPVESNKGLVKIESSSLKALHVAPDTYLFLGIGETTGAKDTVVALSKTNARETAPVASVTVPAGAIGATQSANGLLVAVASELLAESLVQALPSGSSVLVHCSAKDRFLAAALSRRAQAKSVRVTVTYDAENGEDVKDAAWIKLDARSPAYAIQKAVLPAKPSHFLDLTAVASQQQSEVSINIARVLPVGYKAIDLSDISRPEAFLSATGEVLAERLQDAVSAATSVGREQVDDLVISLGKIHDPATAALINTTSAVSWPQEGDVTVQVRPLEATRLFAKDKSYLLVGLTGQIGQSLCEWMVANGAGCVCLTSRNPKVDNKWLESFATTGATVKVFAV